MLTTVQIMLPCDIIIAVYNFIQAERDSELGTVEPESGSQVKFATFEEPNNDDDEEVI